MALCYFDTSTLVKYYVREPGSTWVTGLVDSHDPDTRLPVHTLFMSGAGIAEVSAALSILYRRGLLSRRQRQDAYDHLASSKA